MTATTETPFNPKQTGLAELKDASARAFDVFVKTVDKQSKKLAKLERERRLAIAETIDAWIAQRDETTRAAFFVELEALATRSAAAKIATHPLRPVAQD